MRRVRLGRREFKSRASRELLSADTSLESEYAEILELDQPLVPNSFGSLRKLHTSRTVSSPSHSSRVDIRPLRIKVVMARNSKSVRSALALSNDSATTVQIYSQTGSSLPQGQVVDASALDATPKLAVPASLPRGPYEDRR